MSAEWVSHALDRSEVGTRPRQAILGVAAFVTTWAVIEGLGALTFHRVTPLQTVFARYTVHLLVVLALWGRDRPWRTNKLRLQLVRSAMMLIMPVSFVFGVVRGHSVAWVLTIFWCAPLLVITFAALFAHERAKGPVWIAVLAGWLAAWVYFAPTGRPTLGAIVAGIGMSASFAAYVAMTRGLCHEPISTNLFYTALVPWFGLMPFIRFFWIAPTHMDYIGFAFVGAAGLLGLFALDRGAEAAPLSESAPLLDLQIGATMLITAIEGHTPVFSRMVMAAALVAMSLALSTLALRHRLVPTP